MNNNKIIAEAPLMTAVDVGKNRGFSHFCLSLITQFILP